MLASSTRNESLTRCHSAAPRIARLTFLTRRPLASMRGRSSCPHSCTHGQERSAPHDPHAPPEDWPHPARAGARDGRPHGVQGAGPRLPAERHPPRPPVRGHLCPRPRRPRRRRAGAQLPALERSAPDRGRGARPVLGPAPHAGDGRAEPGRHLDGRERPRRRAHPARLRGAAAEGRPRDPGRAGGPVVLPRLRRRLAAPREGDPGRRAGDRARPCSGSAPTAGRCWSGSGASTTSPPRSSPGRSRAPPTRSPRSGSARPAATARAGCSSRWPARPGIPARLVGGLILETGSQEDLAPVGRGLGGRPLGPVLPDQPPLRRAARALPHAVLRRRGAVPAHLRRQLRLPLRDPQRAGALAAGQGVLHALRRLGAVRSAQAALRAARAPS